jgi:endogenous inhibitor of DNA gyrase (YacG/DUF329 family)
MKAAKCPICGRSMAGGGRAEWPEYPFCSPRCKQIDLGNWLRERYGVPAEEPDDDGPAPGDEDSPS